MTRGEDVQCTSKVSVKYTEYDIRRAFEKGKMFAKNNPDLSSLWHDVTEEPNKDMIFLFEDKYGYHIMALDYNYDWATFIKGLEVQKWAYIDDLLPKGGNQ